MALQVSLNIPAVSIVSAPVIPVNATEEQAAAIQLEIDAVNAHNAGTTYPEAYARISFIRVDAQTAYPVVAWYENQAARERDDFPVHLFEYSTATAGLVGDIYPAAYAWLKTLPEFSGAIDC